MKTKLSLLIVSIFFLAMNSSAFAESMYVKSFQAYLLATPSYSAKKVEKLSRGFQVEKIEKKGLWVKVKANNKMGWLPAMVLSANVFPKKVSLLSQKVDIHSKARRRASTYSSTASARGLVDTARRRVSARQLPDYDALAALEKQTYSEGEALQFLNAAVE